MNSQIKTKSTKKNDGFYYHFLYEWGVSIAILVFVLCILGLFDIHLVILYAVSHGAWLWYLHYSIKNEKFKNS